MHVSCDDQRRKSLIPGAEGLVIPEGSNRVTVNKGEVTLYLAACLTGARMEGTTW